MKISVIIPAFNAEHYIRTAIESCLGQTCPPHEIIVIDDASTDGTAALAESFPSPVRVIRLAENMGVASARNRGVQASTGDWLAFLDADDWFLPMKLELQQRCAAESPNAVLIYTGWRIIGVDGVEFPGRFKPPSEIMPLLRYRCGFHVGTVALRRDAFDAVGGFDAACIGTEDWDLWLRIAARYSVQSFAAVAEPLAVYRRVAGSLSFVAAKYLRWRPYVYKKSSLFGTSGVPRFLWRLKLSSFNYYDTSESLRDEGSHCFLPFMLISLMIWPFPCFAMRNRFKIAIVMAIQTCKWLLSR
ncbi:MAG: glycosyltransferase family 2 protein [Terracidiphilus sp.]|jgi:glycosyltransferase involved in cell wall biosynthesis